MSKATEKSEIEQKEAKASEEKQEAQQQEQEQQFKELKQALKNEIEKAKMENSSNYKEQFKKLFDSKNKLGNQEGGLKLNYGSNKINLKNYCKDNKENETAQVFRCLNVIFLFILHFDSVYLAKFMLKRPFFSFVIISQTPKPTRNNRPAIPPPAPSAEIKISPHSILNV